MHADLDRILITREQLAGRIAELAGEVACDLDTLDRDAEIVLVPVLTGSMIFVADLIRHLPHKIRIEVVTASSYPGRSTASQGASLVGALPEDLTGRHVLIIDDILDSGSTIRLIREELARRGPQSLRTCVLLRKKTDRAMAVPCEYVGFEIADEFVVGYGLDYDNYYRNLPDIAVLRKDVM